MKLLRNNFMALWYLLKHSNYMYSPGVRKLGSIGLDVSVHCSNSWKLVRCIHRADLPNLCWSPWDQILSSKSHREAIIVFSSTPTMDTSTPRPRSTASVPIFSKSIFFVLLLQSYNKNKLVISVNNYKYRMAAKIDR